LLTHLKISPNGGSAPAFAMVMLPFCIIPDAKVSTHGSEERVGLHNRPRPCKITTYTGSFRKEPTQPALRTTTAGRMCGATSHG
jgi:hypothetical protein